MSTAFPDDDRDIPFEFERKFFVRELPSDVREHGSRDVIVQAYVFAEAGYAIRVRMAFKGVELEFPAFNEATDLLGGYERRVLAGLMEQVEASDQQRAFHRSRNVLASDSFASVSATVAVKSPPVSGERYELEVELDQDVAVQILHRAQHIILKTRYSLWYGEDGWEFDVFEGQNRGLVVAECERVSPVVNLAIPPFAYTELTGDPRFTNDSLSKVPWSQWDWQYQAELAARGPYFLQLH